MKKIGILTFWNVPNYGTFLQAYALRNVVQELYPEDKVELISYLDDVHYREYYGVCNFIYKWWPINPRFYVRMFDRILHYKKIIELKSFLEYYKSIPHTVSMSKRELGKAEFDTVILGSDIIWDYTIPIFNNDEFLFGNKLNSSNIISYAASFGTAKEGEECPEYVKNGIRSLNAVSVRESKSAEIVRRITGMKPQIVIDPTFLWDFAKDDKVILPDIKDKYIIVYGSYFTDELVEGVSKYAKENNLKILCLNSLDDSYDWCDINIQQNELSPYEWLGYFAKSEMVMTCTFHGLMFGLIFNKKIAFSPTQFILDKATSFIQALELEDVLINTKSFNEKINWNWDYTFINEKIKNLRKDSIEYLKHSV